MKIIKANKNDFASLVGMALFLWPDEPESELKKEVRNVLASKNQAAFICKNGSDCDAGFIFVSIRREYVPGATVYPLGYVEGIFVKPAFRRKGVAKELLSHGEQWALESGCKHMASDTWVWNTTSQKFHLSAGFLEKETLVFYIKRIDTSMCETPHRLTQAD